MHYIYYRLQTDPEQLYILHIPFPNILMYLIVNTSDAPEHAHKPVGIVAIQRIAVIQPRDDDSLFFPILFLKNGICIWNTPVRIQIHKVADYESNFDRDPQHWILFLKVHLNRSTLDKYIYRGQNHKLLTSGNKQPDLQTQNSENICRFRLLNLPTYRDSKFLNKYK